VSELFLDGFDGRGPHEGLGILIPGLEKRRDGCLQIGYAQEDAAADGLVVQVAEPSLHKIHPTGTGGDEVRHKPGMTFQPRLYFRVLVRSIIVHDQMERDIAGKLGIEQA